MPKKIQLNVAFSAKRFEQIRQLADKADVSMAEIVRQIVDREIGRTARRIVQ